MEYGKEEGREKEKENNAIGLPRIGKMEADKEREDKVIEVDQEERKAMQERINTHEVELYQYKLEKDEQDRAEYLKNKLK